MMALSHLKLALTTTLAVLATNCLFANEALPNVPEPHRPAPPVLLSKPAQAELIVKRHGAAESRIVIPRKMIEQAIGPKARDTSFFSPTRNVAAGVALSAAIVGAFFVVRRKGTKSKVAAACLLCLAVTGGVSCAVADIIIPPKQLKPQIIVVVDDKADAVTLVVGKDFPGDVNRRGRGFGDGSAESP